MTRSTTTKVADAKDTVADRVRTQAEKFREASDAFEGNALASDAVQYLGDNLAQAASAMRDLDQPNVQQDVTQFACRNSLVFFGSAAALSFLAAGALKASNRAGIEAAAADPHNYPSVPDNQSVYPDQNARRCGYSKCNPAAQT